MRAATLVAVAASLGACIHNAPAPGQRPGACAAASIVVLRDVATAAAVDPVETQRAILLSDAFRRSVARAPGAPEPPAALSVERLGRSAVLALRVAEVRDDPVAACNAVLEAALLFGREDLAFLQEQVRRLEAQLAPKEQAVEEFKGRNALVVLPIADRLALNRERQRAVQLALHDPLGRECRGGPRDAQLRAAAEELGREALQLNAVELELRRLDRDLDSTRRQLELVRARLAEATLAGVLSQDLRVLEPCARCRE